ncbi:MAG: formate dehydrogenase accessory sulfurtransferase FdhD [Thermodesulfobacteriota bacterium]
MTIAKPYQTFRSFTLTGKTISPTRTDLIVETPLEIVINGQSHILIMCTPEMIRELVVGFLFTEGLINRAGKIEDLTIFRHRRDDGEVIVEANLKIHDTSPSSYQSSRKRVSYSSCGICGTENYYKLKQGLGRVKSRRRFSMDLLIEVSRHLKRFQPLYTRTGGSHAAFLFDAEGNAVEHCEDMGRHNAVDKVVGSVLLKQISTQDKVLISSGRASLEMILKTARAGFPLFVAMSRPTSRAVEAAKYYNITLVDLAKDSNRIHSHVRRIKGF